MRDPKYSVIEFEGMDITSFSDFAVTSGTTYFYRVVAIVDGAYAASPVASATVPVPER